MFEFNTSNIATLAWEQKRVVNNVKSLKNLSRYIIDSHVLILLCTIVYGAVLGLYSKNAQILFNALKLPLLFLITLYIALPIIFIVDVLQGNKIKFMQSFVLVLLGFNNTAIVLLAFAPLMIFFIVTALDYYFIVLLNIAICGFAGYFGIFSIYENYKQYYKIDTWPHSLTIGSFIIVFGGTQLAWTLRPFFHSYSNFIRPVSGNFYVSLAGLMQSHLGETIILLGIFGLIALAVTFSRIARESEQDKTKNKSDISAKPKPIVNKQYNVPIPPPTSTPTPTIAQPTIPANSAQPYIYNPYQYKYQS